MKASANKQHQSAMCDTIERVDAFTAGRDYPQLHDRKVTRVQLVVHAGLQGARVSTLWCMRSWTAPPGGGCTHLYTSHTAACNRTWGTKPPPPPHLKTLHYCANYHWNLLLSQQPTPHANATATPDQRVITDAKHLVQGGSYPKKLDGGCPGGPL